MFSRRGSAESMREGGARPREPRASTAPGLAPAPAAQLAIEQPPYRPAVILIRSISMIERGIELLETADGQNSELIDLPSARGAVALSLP